MEPLTEQEEAELRAFVADGVLHNPPFTLVAQLLATIDHERDALREALTVDWLADAYDAYTWPSLPKGTTRPRDLAAFIVARRDSLGGTE